MEHFSTLVDEALQNADSRARELGTFLAETSQNAAGSIGDHFDELRATAGRESEKAVATLEETYAGAMRDMEELFAKAVERFRGSAGDVKDMAAEIGREFEKARTELQRATIELPRETAAQAAQVRKVVGQQIEALQALTSVLTHLADSADEGMAVETTAPRRCCRPPRFGPRFRLRRQPRHNPPCRRRRSDKRWTAGQWLVVGYLGQGRSRRRCSSAACVGSDRRSHPGPAAGASGTVAATRAVAATVAATTQRAKAGP